MWTAKWPQIQFLSVLPHLWIKCENWLKKIYQSCWHFFLQWLFSHDLEIPAWVWSSPANFQLPHKIILWLLHLRVYLWTYAAATEIEVFDLSGSFIWLNKVSDEDRWSVWKSGVRKRFVESAPHTDCRTTQGNGWGAFPNRGRHLLPTVGHTSQQHVSSFIWHQRDLQLKCHSSLVTAVWISHRRVDQLLA